MKNACRFVFLACMFLFHTAFAVPVISLNDDIAFFEVTPRHLSKYKDPSNRLTIEDIDRLPPSAFYQDQKMYTEDPDVTYWIRFAVRPDTDKRNKWVLEVLDSRHYEVELYAPGKDGHYHVVSTGWKYPFESRSYQHKNLVMDLNLQAHASNVFYLKVHSKVVGSLLFKIRSNEEFSSYAFNEYYFLGIYYGIIAIICLLNLILYFSIGERIYLVYFAYVLSWGFHSMLDDGTGYQYLWPDFPSFTSWGFLVSTPLLLMFFTWYSRIFLELPRRQPQSDRWVLYSMGFYLVNYSLNIFIPYPDGLIYGFFLLHFLLVYVFSIHTYKQGFKPSRFFIIGNSFIVVGFVLRFMKDLGIVDLSGSLSIAAIYSRNAAILLEIGILFLALGDRFRFLKQQKDEAQAHIIAQLEENKKLSEKVNRELEQKVAERTLELLDKSKELEVLNGKLRLQAEEINRWNQRLDLDNHQLKQKIRQVNEARIKSEEVSYEEFLQIFSDDLACQRYIEEIKWKDGFQCKKCGNSKYCAGARIFSRRCTRCGYSESVTAFTFLHKCKFSLVKAFYIMMKVNQSGDDINCAELSRMLDMRKSTVWEFKNKVMECKEGKNMDLDYLLLHNLK